MKALIFFFFFFQTDPIIKDLYVNTIIDNQEVCKKTSVFLNVTDKAVDIKFLHQVYELQITSTQTDGTLILKDIQGNFYTFSGTKKAYGFILENEDGEAILYLATYNMCD